MHNGNGTLLFGDWQVDPELNRLLRDGEEHKLEPKAMDVLVCLLEHQGHVVSTSDILDQVWVRQVVEEGAVHQRIAQIRRALGDDSRHPKYIESIPRRGYRAMVEATAANGEGLEARRPQALRPWMLWSVGGLATGAAGLALILAIGRPMSWFATSADTSPPDSVTTVRFAVQPIRDLSSNQRLGTIPDRLTQALRHELARYELGIWPEWIIKLAPPSTTGQASQQGAEPDLDYRLEGTLSRQNEGLLLSVSLTDIGAADQLWLHTFQSEDSSDAALNQLANQATRLAVWFGRAISPNGGGPSNRAAYAAFSESLKLDGGDQPDEGVFWLQRTLELDPDWRGGWEELAWAWLYYGQIRRDASYFQLALDAHERGDPSTFLKIEMKAYVDGDLDGAEADARDFTLSSSDGMAYGYAWLMLHSGLHREAESFFRWFNEQMPHHPGGIRVKEMTSALRDDAFGAVEASRELAGTTSDSVNLLYGAAWGLPRLGRLDEARALYDKVSHEARRLTPDSATAFIYDKYLAVLAFEIAMAERDLESARAAAERHAEMGSHASAGIRFLRLGDPRAEHHLRRAEQDAPFIRRDWLWYVAFTPPELRTHPAFIRLQDALGYTSEWRQELCRRASAMPTHTHVTCDPTQFETHAAI